MLWIHVNFFLNHIIFELVWLGLSIYVQIFFFKSKYDSNFIWLPVMLKKCCWPDDFLDMLLLSEAFRSFLSLIDSLVPRWVSSINFSLLTIHICLQYEFIYLFFLIPGNIFLLLLSVFVWFSWGSIICIFYSTLILLSR